MSSRQKYPRAATQTSPRIRRVGVSFQVNTEALLAAPIALQERRGSSAPVYTEGSEFDVLSVMAERDAFVYLTASSLQQATDLAVWKQCSYDQAANLLLVLLPAIADAEMLLWHKEIWRTAVGTNGSAEAFHGSAYRAGDLPARVQYWGFNRDIVQSPEALAELGLPAGWINQSWVLFPLPARGAFLDTPADQRPAYLRALNETGARQMLLAGPSLLALAVYNREVAGLSAAEALALPADVKVPRLRFFPPMPLGKPCEGGPYDLLLAGLSFLQQEFVEERPQVLADRPTRRRLEAAGASLPAVRTVAFRKAAPSSDDPAGERGPYDCHFLVGAHWRKPSARMLEPRPVFVRPYVKGNTDKPFKPPQETVKVVKR